MVFSFRNGNKLLKTEFKCSYPRVKDTSVMQNDQCLAKGVNASLTSATIEVNFWLNFELETDKAVVWCPVSLNFQHHACCVVGQTKDFPQSKT